MSPDGGEIVKMGLDALGQVVSPSWSPDWQSIVFAAYYDEPREADIYVVPAGCVDLPEGCLAYARNLTSDSPPGVYAYPDWSPSGEEIVYAYIWPQHSYPRVGIMNADGSEPRLLPVIRGFQFSWSPGNLIAFTSDVIGEEWGVFEGETQCTSCGNVFTTNVDGTGTTRLTSLLPDSGSPAWSPDGALIAVTTFEGRSPADVTVLLRIYLLDADGSNARRLSPDNLAAYSPRWSPDGTRVLFVSDWPEPGIYIIDLDGSNLTLLTFDEGPVTLAWAP